ncbi:MAG: MFS transporter [Armatimonadetes bacterium]|nr:MFS transporter [Armatimonadota bacterium]
MGFWNGLRPQQRLILVTAWLGWVFDIMDTALFAFAKGPMLTSMLGGAAAYKLHGPAIEGRMQMLFLFGWAIGGLIFGILADRWGRTRVLIWTILFYCLFTAATVLCQTPDQVMLARFCAGLGIGGEWAAGAALVAEMLSDSERASAASFLQTAAAFGPILAATANLVIARTMPPEHFWRALFLVGALPAALAVVIRLIGRDWEPQRAKAASQPFPLREFGSDSKLRGRLILTIFLGFAGIAGAGNIAFWLPNLVASVSQGLSQVEIQTRQTYATYILHIGTLAGVLVFPRLCDRIGRRRSFAFFFAAAPAALLFVGFIARDPVALLLMAPVISFFAIGLTAGYALYLPELFPKRVRATGIGIAYNTGRVLNAPVPSLTGMAISHFGGSIFVGVVMTAALYAVGLAVLPFAPETRGQRLPA